MKSEQSVALRIHEAAIEVELVTSLVETLVERVESIQKHYDPEKAAKVTADLARIAAELLEALLRRLTGAAEAIERAA